MRHTTAASYRPQLPTTTSCAAVPSDGARATTSPGRWSYRHLRRRRDARTAHRGAGSSTESDRRQAQVQAYVYL